MNSNPKRNLLAFGIGLSLLACIGLIVANQIKKRDRERAFDLELSRFAEECEKEPPTMLSTNTRLDKVYVGPGHAITWLATMVNINSAQVQQMTNESKVELQNKVRSFLSERSKQSKNFKIFQHQRFTLNFVYYTSDHSEITRTTLLPGEY